MLLQGAILNQTGVTSIATTGAIAGTGDSAYIASRQIALSATGNIGSGVLALANNLTEPLAPYTGAEDIYLGSAPVDSLERLLLVNQIQAGSAADPGSVRIKVGAGISNAASPGQFNEMSGDLLLEAGDGCIGTVAHRCAPACTERPR